MSNKQKLKFLKQLGFKKEYNKRYAEYCYNKEKLENCYILASELKDFNSYNSFVNVIILASLYMSSRDTIKVIKDNKIHWNKLGYLLD